MPRYGQDFKMSTGPKMRPLIRAYFDCECNWIGDIAAVPPVCIKHFSELDHVTLIGAVGHPDYVMYIHGWAHKPE